MKKNCTAKFNESIDVSLNFKFKTKKEAFTLRTVVNLPHGNGKKIKVAVFVKKERLMKLKLPVQMLWFR